MRSTAGQIREDGLAVISLAEAPLFRCLLAVWSDGNEAKETAVRVRLFEQATLREAAEASGVLRQQVERWVVAFRVRMQAIVAKDPEAFELMRRCMGENGSVGAQQAAQDPRSERLRMRMGTDPVTRRN